MRVSWREYGADSAPSEAVVYTVNFHESIKQSVNCSAECLVYISDPSADPNSKFSVVVTNTKTGLTETVIVYFVDVPSEFLSNLQYDLE
jgi:predicted membrane-bound spermidine synthase